MQTKIVERYFFFGLLLSTLIFTFFIFRPFWIVLTLGICFSIVLYPIYEWFRKISPSWVSSLFTVILFTILVCGPLLGIGVIIFNQSQDLYHSVINNGNSAPFLDSLSHTINGILPSGIDFDIQAKASQFVSYITNNIANIFSATLSAFFSFVLMLLIMFYFLKDGAEWKKTLVALSPLGDNDDEKIINRLSRSVNAVIKGSLLIALIQGVLMGLGLFIFGVPNAALWGVVASICSLLPTIGTALVSVPAIIFLFATGHTTQAVGLTIWSFIAVGTIDNFLSPFIVGGTINIPPLLILFAILGGISLLGPVGILVGPLAISLLYTLISIYRNEYKQKEQ
jgi:predicted PurR-regulated permease PerM